ncbi:MAG TPA: hypothetical protein VEC76_08675 [Streptosporangiaceae bacterium]|nr:hypothetical protein [Streptosporangiaceae bacterium]
MADDWRIHITFPSQPRLRGKSSLRTVVDDLHSHLGDHVPVSSGKAHVFVYTATPGAARAADEIARVVLAQLGLSAEFRLEHWDPLEEAWLDAPDEPPDEAAAQRAAHEHQQEQERERSAATGRAAWQVRVELGSRQDVTALAERLASEGWPVVRRRRYLVAGANCEDDADSLAQQIEGYGHPGAVIHVQRSDTAASMPQAW